MNDLDNIDSAAAKLLFAPFPEHLVPRNCGDGSQLTSLLQTPLNMTLGPDLPSCLVAMNALFDSHSRSSTAVQTVAQGTAEQSFLNQWTFGHLLMGEVIRAIATAADSSPGAEMSELTWCGWWDALTRVFACLAAKRCGLPIRVDRDVHDDSITLENKRRDFLLWLQGALIVGGEHKKANMPLPVDELRAKHKSVNSALYGQLEYILLYASAGATFQMYAIPVCGGDLVPVTGVLCAAIMCYSQIQGQ